MEQPKYRIHIAPSSMHDYLMNQLLKQQDVLLATSITSFDVFLNNQNTHHQNYHRLFALAFSIIQENKQHCTILQASLHYPQIIQSLFNLAAFIHQHEIDLQSLPSKTAKEKDIAHCVRIILPLFKEQLTLSQFKKLPIDFNQITIYPFKTDLTQQLMLDHLLQHGARKETYQQPTQNKEARYALNVAQEAFGIVQYILNHPYEKIVVVVCDPTTSKQALIAACNRAQITIKDTQSAMQHPIIKQFMAALQVVINPSLTSLKEYLFSQTQHIELAFCLLEYIETFQLTYQQCFSPFDHVSKLSLSYEITNKKDVEYLIKLEAQAELARQKIIEALPVFKDDNIDELFETFVSDYQEFDPIKQKAIHQIKQVIEQIWPTPNPLSDKCNLICYALEQIQTPIPTQHAQLMITTLHEPFVEPCDTLIYMSANHRFFPGFNQYKGIIDEAYMQQLPIFSLKQRLTHHTEQLLNATKSSKHLIISSANATFEGKAMGIAPALSVLFDKSDFKPWDIVEIGKQKRTSYQLNPEISQQLFFKDKQLHGSISSFERFFQCPTKYYYQSGLKLKKQQAIQADSAMLGTIAHAVFERLVKAHPKAYGLTLLSDLRHLITQLFDDLLQLYPSNHAYWAFIIEQLSESLDLSLKIANEMEMGTDFKNKYLEQKFELTWPLKDDASIVLKGIIDRIDVAGQTFRIIDYKSSTKSLSATQVKGGLQLQLITYLVVAKATLKMNPSGAHYFSLQHPNIEIKPRKATKTKHEILDSFDHRLEFLKKHQLSGWFVNEDVSMYHDATTIQHIQNDKLYGRPYSLDKITDLLNEIYKQLVLELKAGSIENRPIEKACTYCDYKSICIFNKSAYKPIAYFKDVDLKVDKP